MRTANFWWRVASIPVFIVLLPVIVVLALSSAVIFMFAKMLEAWGFEDL